MRKRGIFGLDRIGGWIIAIIILVIMVVGYMIFKEKIQGAIGFILNYIKSGFSS